jgi:aryl-alcohol dehydrogenase-like predicted oxidoreductase
MHHMDRKPLGRTGMSVHPLGLAGSFGVSADAVEHAFHAHGVNYFFVTPRAKQMMEGVRRLIAAGHRDELVIAGGAGLPTGGGVERSNAKLCKLLRTDRVDVFHLFWVQAEWYTTGKTWPAMRALKESGRARALAFSCHDRRMAARLGRELELDLLMIRYNAAHRGAEREVFAELEGPGRPAFCAYTATRWRKLLEPLEGHPPMTAGECYRFALAHPSVDVVLCGAADRAQVDHAAAAVAAGPLAPARLEEIKRFGDAVRAKYKNRSFFGVN